MVTAAKTGLAVVFLMIFTVFLSLGLPAEDVLGAVYDESESVPYEVTPLFSVALRGGSARTAQAPLSSLHLRAAAPSPFTPVRVRDRDANRSVDGRISLALLCTLLC